MVLKIGCEHCFKSQELDYGRKFWGRFYTNKRIHIYVYAPFLYSHEGGSKRDRERWGREGDNRIYPHDIRAGEEKTTIKSCAGSFWYTFRHNTTPLYIPRALYTHENTVYRGGFTKEDRGRGGGWNCTWTKSTLRTHV